MYLLGLLDAYEWAWTQIDHRMDGRLFMSSLTPIFVVLLAYLATMISAFRWIRHRKALSCVAIGQMYIAAIILMNAYIFFQVLLGSTRLNYSWLCETNHPESRHEEENRLIEAAHAFHLLKMAELLDSVLLTLFKVVLLPNVFMVYHHASVVVASWIYARWIPTGATYLPVLFNTFAHVITYLYVFFYVMKKSTKKNVTIRVLRNLTAVAQNVQYVAIYLICFYGIFTDCGFGAFISGLCVLYMMSLLIVTLLVH